MAGTVEAAETEPEAQARNEDPSGLPSTRVGGYEFFDGKTIVIYQSAGLRLFSTCLGSVLVCSALVCTALGCTALVFK